jgi:uncharacterized protein YegL
MSSSLGAPRKTAVWIWSAALLLSAGLHVGLLRLNPNLFLGSGDFLRTPARQERHQMRVEKSSAERMKQELPKLLDRFEPVDPLQSASESPIDLPDPASALLDQALTALPEPERFHPSAPIPEETPLLSAAESDWQPRQEVLTVTEARVKETLEVLPRQLRDVETDRPGAPDISLPGIAPDIGGLTETVSVRYQALDRRIPGKGMLGLPEFSPNGPVAGTALTRPGDLPDLAMPVLESPTEITNLDAVESLLRLETRIYDDPENPDARYFKIQLLPKGLDALPVLPRDVVYLVDCSASMTERKLRLAVDGINASLETLSEADRVNVLAFRDAVEQFSSEGVPATVFGKAKARTFLSSLHARGQTDVYASLHALQQLPRTEKRPMLALLVTDGVPTQGLTDSSEIIDQFSRANQGEISVFGLGAGGRVNRLLLDFLSFRNRGASLVAPQAAGLTDAVLQSAKEVRRPVLMNLSYQFSGVTEPEIYPRHLSHLYLDRPLILIGRIPKSQKEIAFQIVGSSAKGDHDLLFTLNLDEAADGGASLRQEWAWQALLEKLSSSIGSPGTAAQADVQQLIENYNLVIPEAYQPQPAPRP